MIKENEIETSLSMSIVKQKKEQRDFPQEKRISFLFPLSADKDNSVDKSAV